MSHIPVFIYLIHWIIANIISLAWMLTIVFSFDLLEKIVIYLSYFSKGYNNFQLKNKYVHLHYNNLIKRDFV